MGSITHGDVVKWVGDITPKTAPATVHHCYQVLAGVLHLAALPLQLVDDPERVGRDRAAELAVEHDNDGAPSIPTVAPSPDRLAIRFMAAPVCA
ncbi:hypothetical protein IU479_05710 [Nocardia abscessus]|uniref:hypothetical protein n=1 Tax=Nocardia TaxID=1817 RepID=UPI001894BA9B|nr:MULTISPECIES: hypothetical protein [Nocardia]MBF6217602.1 hypothetical protein [Nocardia abscessus]MDE1669787.1 hypothetical protein [Nocardia gipuzkoensis]